MTGILACCSFFGTPSPFAARVGVGFGGLDRRRLKAELPNYWDVRLKAIVLLDFFAKLDSVAGMEHWKDGCDSARAGALRNGHE